ncbi:MAG: toll/interleukin-1 receptor domain-containing protein [Leptolyngbya sp. SIO3F4]|nr:toll/interleukin-1 receptor domain-containing protein [Leptolyngbya sp. SIO3F4]
MSQRPADDTYKYDVFISYSTADKAWVRGELLTRLQNAGLKVCIDFRDFRRGAPTVTEIERLIEASARTLLILTPAYLESQWTEFETLLLQTFDPTNRELRLLPLLKEQCELPKRLKIYTYVDFAEPDDPIFVWTQLLTALDRRPEAERPKEYVPQEWLLAHPYGMPPNFTGRVAERQLLSDWLNHGSQPLMVLRALGGFGKSALTWHWLLNDVAEQDWSKVVWWSFYEEKAGFDNFVYSTLAYLSGQKPDSLNPSDRVRQLLRYLLQHRILLVLDGFERELRAYGNLGAAYQGDGERKIADAGRDCINPGAEQFLRNLASLPRLQGKVLMSTRLRPRPVELTGGILLQGCREEVLTQMDPADAVAFFRAQGIRGNRGEIEQACRAYGFHPLSLRLLAGLVVKDLRNPGDIQAAQRKNLTGKLVQRQHHVLEQSYNGLSLDGQQLLSRIACFRSPVKFEVLEKIVQLKQEPKPEPSGILSWVMGKLLPNRSPQTSLRREALSQSQNLQTKLQDLIERGLVQREGRRFDLHPIVRRYAYDCMGTTERSSTHGQLRDYFAAVPAVEQVTTVDDLAPVIELYHHIVRAGQYDEAMNMFYERLSTPLYFQLGAYQQQVALLRALFPKGETQPPQLQSERNQSWTLNSLANSYSLSGQPAQAVPLFEQAVAIYEKGEKKQYMATCLGNLAHAAQIHIGALRSAEANLRRVIALCQEIEAEFNEAVGHTKLGQLLAYRGAWRPATEELDRALELFEKVNNVQFLGVTWAYRALSALLRTRSPQTSDSQRAELAATALAAARRAIALADKYARTNYPLERDYVRAHWLLGTAHRLTPNLSQSDHHLNEAIHRCRAINLVEMEADILLDLARLRRDQGNLSEALRLAEDARAIATRSGYVLKGADIHLFLAELAQTKDNLSEARTLAQTALQLATCDGGEFVYRVAYDEAMALQLQLGE